MAHGIPLVIRNPMTLDCQGRCSCGFLTKPDNDREVVWAELSDHVLTAWGIYG